MSFVGQVAKYVEKYTDEMMATSFLPAELLEASIKFRTKFIRKCRDDETYVNEVLPKMDYNLKSLKNIVLVIKTMGTVAVLKMIQN